MPCPCRAPAVPLPCPCCAHGVPMPFPRRAPAVPLLCPCRAHAVPMPCPYRAHAAPLIHTCHAATLPCSDSVVSFMKVRVVAGNIRTASAKWQVPFRVLLPEENVTVLEKQNRWLQSSFWTTFLLYFVKEKYVIVLSKVAYRYKKFP